MLNMSSHRKLVARSTVARSTAEADSRALRARTVSSCAAWTAWRYSWTSAASAYFFAVR
jgi:hypothetical protein